MVIFKSSPLPFVPFLVNNYIVFEMTPIPLFSHFFFTPIFVWFLNKWEKMYWYRNCNGQTSNKKEFKMWKSLKKLWNFGCVCLRESEGSCWIWNWLTASMNLLMWIFLEFYPHNFPWNFRSVLVQKLFNQYLSLLINLKFHQNELKSVTQATSNRNSLLLTRFPTASTVNSFDPSLKNDLKWIFLYGQ